MCLFSTKRLGRITAHYAPTAKRAKDLFESKYCKNRRRVLEYTGGAKNRALPLMTALCCKLHWHNSLQGCLAYLCFIRSGWCSRLDSIPGEHPHPRPLWLPRKQRLCYLTGIGGLGKLNPRQVPPTCATYFALLEKCRHASILHRL